MISNVMHWKLLQRRGAPRSLLLRVGNFDPGIWLKNEISKLTLQREEAAHEKKAPGLLSQRAAPCDCAAIGLQRD